MYLNHFQLREEPFGSTPDPRFLYLGMMHREALATLYYGYYSNRGFTALIAQPGMGKTTLLFQFLQHVRESARTVFLFQTQCNTRELFRYLLYDLGLKPGEDIAEMHQQLNGVLAEEARAGRRVVLVIDEAQNLPDELLETVRLLSDFETARAKLMQIVLAGQPQLSEKLASPGLEQLRQRISLLCRLDGFTAVETADYIRHRLVTAGHAGPLPFTAGAMDRIAGYTEGSPRRINTLCFNALSLCCALKRAQVDRGIVEEAIADQDFSRFTPVLVREDHELKPKPRVQHQRTARVRGKEHRLRRALLTAAAVVLSVLASSAFTPKWQQDVMASVAASSAPAVPAVSEAFLSGLTQPAQPLPEPAVAPPAPAPRNSGTNSMVVTVAPEQTLHEISSQYLGGFDLQRYQQIKALNPSLTDPDHLQAGQRIRLPRESRTTQAATQASTAADRN